MHILLLFKNYLLLCLNETTFRHGSNFNKVIIINNFLELVIVL